MQNSPDLPPPSKENKTKRKRLAKARPGKVDEVVLSDFAALAIRLGFKSDQISALSQDFYHCQMAGISAWLFHC
jgi:hypothetical protein